MLRPNADAIILDSLDFGLSRPQWRSLRPRRGWSEGDRIPFSPSRVGPPVSLLQAEPVVPIVMCRCIVVPPSLMYGGLRDSRVALGAPAAWRCPSAPSEPLWTVSQTASVAITHAFFGLLLGFLRTTGVSIARAGPAFAAPRRASDCSKRPYITWRSRHGRARRALKEAALSLGGWGRTGLATPHESRPRHCRRSAPTVACVTAGTGKCKWRGRSRGAYHPRSGSASWRVETAALWIMPSFLAGIKPRPRADTASPTLG